MLYNTIIASQLNYADVICGALKSNRLQVIQNTAVRKINNSGSRDSAGPLLQRIGWVNVDTKTRFTKQQLYINL